MLLPRNASRVNQIKIIITALSQEGMMLLDGYPKYRELLGELKNYLNILICRLQAALSSLGEL